MTLQEYISFWQETYDKSQSRPTTYAAHHYVFKNQIFKTQFTHLDHTPTS